MVFRNAQVHKLDFVAEALKAFSIMEAILQKADAVEAEMAQGTASVGVASKGKAVEKRREVLVSKVRAAKKAKKKRQKPGVREHGGRLARVKSRKFLKKSSDESRGCGKGPFGVPGRKDSRGAATVRATVDLSETVEMDAVIALVNAVEKATKAQELASHQVHGIVKRAGDEVMLTEMKVTLWALFVAMENRGRTRQVAMNWSLCVTAEDLVRARLQKVRREHDQEMEFQLELMCGMRDSCGALLRCLQKKADTGH